MRKDWILISIVGLIFVIGLGLIGYLKLSRKNIATNPQPSGPTQEVAGAQTQVTYFSEDAKVLYFYSDYCHWCQKEKTVLEELGKEGYKVRPMNVGEQPELAKDYNISGTPTFIAQNGDRLEGYRDKDPLKAWLDQHK